MVVSRVIWMAMKLILFILQCLELLGLTLSDMALLEFNIFSLKYSSFGILET